MKVIVHRSFEDGDAQYLKIHINDHDLAVGIVLPGEYEFGPADSPRHLMLIAGTWTLNGVERHASDHWVPIKTGDPIAVLVKPNEPAVFTCQYDSDDD